MEIKQLLAAAPAILEASSEAIATLDELGNVKGYNSRFLSLLGVDEMQAGELQFNQLFPEVELDGCFAQEDFDPVKLSRPDGSSLWILMKLVSIGDQTTSDRTLLLHDPDTIRRIIDRLDYIESYDVATGLKNSRKGLLEFEQMLTSGFHGGCILLQIEQYRSDPDTLNHFLDDALALLARHFALIHEQHVLCRYSATELLYVYTSEAPLIDVTYQKLIDAVRNERLVMADAQVSMAFEAWRDGDKRSVTDLLDQLVSRLTSVDDQSLLQKMTAGSFVGSRASFVSQLRQALGSDELDYFIQPQISAESRQVIGGELLIRWIPQGQGVIPTSQFVNFLEQGDFSPVFFNWSVRRSIEILLQLHETLGFWLPLSLNLAATHFHDRDMMQRLASQVHEAGIPDRMLEIEVTERILAQDVQTVLDNLLFLREQGFKISIDDFGTGYSSLSYLRKFPLDTLKIDRVFVSNLAENEEDRLIVNSVVSLAHVLGLEVVAEGVEEPFQARFLKNIDCEYFQGFLTGKPMPVREFVKFVQQNPAHSDWSETPIEYRSDRALDQQRKVKWKKSFSTDLVSIDNEHRELIELLNQYASEFALHPEKMNPVLVMDELGAHTLRHFEHEEAVMQNIGYSRFEAHREKHKWLMADLAKRKLELVNGDQASFEEILQYLKYWLLRHLVSEDTHLHRFINKSAKDKRT